MRGKGNRFGGPTRLVRRMANKHYKKVTKQVSNYWLRKKPKEIESTLRKQFSHLKPDQLDVKVKKSKIKFLKGYENKLKSTFRKFDNRSKRLEKRFLTVPTRENQRNFKIVNDYATHLENELFSVGKEINRLQGKNKGYSVVFMRQWQFGGPRKMLKRAYKRIGRLELLKLDDHWNRVLRERRLSDKEKANQLEKIRRQLISTERKFEKKSDKLFNRLIETPDPVTQDTLNLTNRYIIRLRKHINSVGTNIDRLRKSSRSYGDRFRRDNL